MFSTVTSWWSKGEEKKDADAKDTSDPVMKESPDSGIAENVESPTEGTPPPAEASEGDSESGSADKQTPLSPTQEFEEVSAKAIHAAKDWGSKCHPVTNCMFHGNEFNYLIATSTSRALSQCYCFEEERVIVELDDNLFSHPVATPPLQRMVVNLKMK